MVKFSSYDDYEFALKGGPWLIYNHYLTVRPWSPNFDPEEYEIQNLAVWVRLYGLLLRFYDKKKNS